MTTEAETYLKKALKEFTDIKEKNKKIIEKILILRFSKYGEYEFDDYDALFDKEID